MSDFESVDPILSRWADVNSIAWLTKYQDTEVRTFYLNPSARDRVQIAVDPPRNNQTIVRVGQNRRGLWRLNRVKNVTCAVSRLPEALDEAYAVAKSWLD